MPKSHAFAFNPAEFLHDILSWYRTNRRVLPWRATKGQKANPYHVWLSEIMLQQTTVPTVIPYFQKFTTLWPSIDALANAAGDDVMHHWAGLGYYARARNLHKCAKVIHTDYHGIFPSDIADLITLPGIGPYTAAAIRAIAFDQPSVVVDGNIERITARIFAVATPLPVGKKEIVAKAAQLYDGLLPRVKKESARDLPQALMDLGSGVCTPTKPACGHCPVAKHCKARAQGNPADYPHRAPKKITPTRVGHVYCLTNRQGDVALVRREEDRMLGGMMGFPTTDWDIPNLANGEGALQHPEWVGKPEKLKNIGEVRHSFSHFHLKLTVWAGKIPDKPRYSLHRGQEISYYPKENLNDVGFPSVFRKVVRLLISI